MALILRPVFGLEVATKQQNSVGYDELVLDGVVIGICLHADRFIKWQPYPKKDIPKSVRKEAVQLCMKRDKRGGI